MSDVEKDSGGRAALVMRVGAREITPMRLGPLAGYEARHGADSLGGQDPLEAMLLVLSDGVEDVGWLTIDAIAVPHDLAAALRDVVRGAWLERGHRAPDVIVTASHTHSAPRGWVGSIHPGHGGEVRPADVDELIGHVRTLAEHVAGSAAEPVRADWGDGRVVGLGANRIDPQGPYDDSIGVLLLRGPQSGAVRAAVFDTGAHPTVLGPKNLHWSADWPGAARRVLRAALGSINEAADLDAPPPTVLFLQGAAGDVSARFTRRGDDIAEVARLGSLAASAAFDAAVHPSATLPGPLRFHSRVLELPRRPLPSPEQAASELANAIADREALAELPPLDPRARLAQSRVDGAQVQESLVLAQLDETVRFPVSVVVLGDIAWVHLPVELFADIGRRIREGSPFPFTRVVGYSDDYLGYMVDERAAALGTYEALSSFFLPDAADQLVADIRHLLEEIS